MSLTLRVDGREVAVADGASVREACAAAGVTVPTLCFNDGFRPANACRLCVVELEGARALVAACSTAAEAGMRIATSSERVRHSRRMVLEFLDSSVDLSQAVGLASTLAESVQGRNTFGPDAETVVEPVKIDNPLYVRDYSKCVLCYRCVQACGAEAQNTFAISVSGRGFEARIATEYDVALPDSACVYCGNCVQVCPTGALAFKTEYDLRVTGRWDESSQHQTTTVCPFCGVGCSLDLLVQDNQVVRVTSPSGDDITHGNLCIKGRFGTQTPIRRGGGPT